MNNNNQRTLQQRRAASAYRDVNSVPITNNKEYGSLVRGLPAQIQHDGLAATLAFLIAKDKNRRSSPHPAAYTHIAEWVLKRSERFNANGHQDFIQFVLDARSDVYRQIANE